MKISAAATQRRSPLKHSTLVLICAAEKEITAVKSKQQAAERAYAAALQAKEEERAAALAADSEAAALEAEAIHCRAELQSGQVGACRIATYC